MGAVGGEGCGGIPSGYSSLLSLPSPYKFHWFGNSVSVSFLAGVPTHVGCVNLKSTSMFGTSLEFRFLWSVSSFMAMTLDRMEISWPLS